MQLRAPTLLAWLASGKILSFCHAHSHLHHLHSISEKGSVHAETGKSLNNHGAEEPCTLPADIARQELPATSTPTCRTEITGSPRPVVRFGADVPSSVTGNDPRSSDDNTRIRELLVPDSSDNLLPVIGALDNGIIGMLDSSSTLSHQPLLKVSHNRRSAADLASASTDTNSLSTSTVASVDALLSVRTDSTSSSIGKRGICFNSASLVEPFSGAVSWAYNWAATETSELGAVQFVPMMHKRDDVATFASRIDDATHVLSFNEPDLPAQADLSPLEAAQYHSEGMKNLVDKVQIGSPAVTNGITEEPPMGIPWLDQFLQLCGQYETEEGIPCRVDFVAYHWYATADSFENFKNHTNAVIEIAAKYGINKVWLTEFNSIGSLEDQANFMAAARPFLDSTPEVERYAAFMASEGTLLTGSTLNTVGSAYVGQS